jgi:5'(3')-deoxyribonucleotidase
VLPVLLAKLDVIRFYIHALILFSCSFDVFVVGTVVPKFTALWNHGEWVKVQYGLLECDNPQQQQLQGPPLAIWQGLSS